jgi:signal transduction histidine kinase
VSPPDRDEALKLVAKSFSAAGHELAGPLQTALNALFLLEKRRARLPEELAGPLRTVEQAVETLRARLDHLLRLPHGFHAMRATTNGATMVAQALLGVGEGSRRVVQLRPAPADPLELDEESVTGALTELLANALSAAPPGEPVTLETGLDGGRLSFTVSNTGGAWPEPPEAAVDPFFTSQARTLGLGLAIARAVALAHDGDLAIQREGGTTRVTLTVLGAAAP